MSSQEPKSRGVVDIVFLVDITGSMEPCISALKNNISQFIHSLTTRDANNSCPVSDWRARVVGYRDFVCDEIPFVDNPFVREPAELTAQLSGLHADGGGDEPESLLDALYKVVEIGQTEKGAQSEDPRLWRYRSSAARVVIVFTDASFHPTMAIPEARGGGITDLFNSLTANRICLSIFAPDMPCYDELSQVDKSEYEAIPFDSTDPEGPQKALAQYTSNRVNFANTLKQLAASVSKSAATPEL